MPENAGSRKEDALPAAEASRQPAITDTTNEFEEYTAPARLGPDGKPVAKAKGLNASGYNFPPAGGPPPPLTKANLAKGIGVPEIPRPQPPARSDWSSSPPRSAAASQPVATPAPAVKVDEGELFEEYHRPDLKEKPRTGKGLRHQPPPAPGEPGGPMAKDILATLPEPELQVFTPKRFNPYQVRPSHPARPSHPDRDRAELDAAADLAVHRAWLEAATMSTPLQGPTRAVVEDAQEQAPLDAPQQGPSEENPVLPSIAPAPNLLPPNPEAPMHTDSTGPTATALQATRVPYVAPVARETMIADRDSGHPGVGRQSAAPREPHASGAPPVPVGGDVPRIALVQSDYHFELTSTMAAAAIDRAISLGATIVHHLHVPGAYDLPLTVQTLLERDDVDAVACIGAIVQGETGHDALIAGECARRLSDLALAHRKPVGLGVTGPGMTMQQAWARVGAGATAVESCVVQHRVLRQLAN